MERKGEDVRICPLEDMRVLLEQQAGGEITPLGSPDQSPVPARRIDSNTK